MRDRAFVWMGLITLLAVSLACNAFAGQRESTLPPPPQPTIIAPPVDATAPAGPAPTALPGLAATATLPGEATTGPGQGTVLVLTNLNVRAGPGVGFRRLGAMRPDDTAVVLGRDVASGWWRVECPPDIEAAECWVSGAEQYTRLLP